MPELRLVTVSEDGGALVLQGDGPHTFTLPITEALRAAVRGDRSRLGQLEIALESQLTPKEIQTRIRHGESAEDVARAAGVPVERIRRFEGPVLGERDNIATRARAGTLRRADRGQPPVGPTVLEDAVLARLGVEHEAVGWDAWRREDGRWTVQVTYRSGAAQKRAHFVYDVTSRASLPEDDDARWLAGEEPVRRAAPARVARLVPVDDLPDTVPAEGDLDAADDDTAPAGTGPVGVPNDGSPFDAEQGDSARSASHDVDVRHGDSGSDDVELTDAGPDISVDLRSADEPADADAPRGARRAAGGKGRRASVPSWDEIVFGRRRD